MESDSKRRGKQKKREERTKEKVRRDAKQGVCAKEKGRGNGTAFKLRKQTKIYI